MAGFRDDFEGDRLDESVWFPYYLPAWSSRELTEAVYRLADSNLTLHIPPDKGLWCAEDHPVPIRVSGIQSGSYSGPVGSSAGQQRFRDDLRVREEQPRLKGWLPKSGRAEIRCRMYLSPRSMAAMWLAGFEENPDDAGEICVVEVFGKGIDGHSAEVGVGIKKVHDPRLTHDFVCPRLELEASEYHVYAVEWDDLEAEFLVDGQVIHSSRNPPTYPMQAMVAIFDFPDWGSDGDDHVVPSFAIDWIAGTSVE
jgi:Glycosyl hydrolases family 16